MPNRLARETSPYLLQHADNPVDWYPWGEEAFARARTEGKPVLLSVGYAACHWCHVMAHESFEDEATARVMNERFVNVKVDREERPDVDSIYMTAVQSMTGHGGWPMTVFLTPDGYPFYGGTYFPPEDRHGMPSFTRVLQAVSDTFTKRPEGVAQSAAAMREIYENSSAPARSSGALTAATLERAFRSLATMYDGARGGFGGAPKFPQAMAMDFLLRYWRRTGTEYALQMVAETFGHMSRGGIYDQVGGGFARYSTDADWLVPHFEKMLYDNALLARLGVHLWQATRHADVRRVTQETLDWVRQEMTSPGGGFYSTLDADSEGHEGKFYVWDEAELDRLLPADDARAVKLYWGVTSGGNFEGRNILNVPADPRVVAQRARVELPALEAAVARARATLYDERSRRVWPARDEKILAGWNGLMLRAMAEAARAFGHDGYREAALANGEFLLAHLVHRTEGGGVRVMRSHKDGVTRIAGFLEDHAAVALGFLSLYELTFEREWLDHAREIADACVARFWDDAAGAFYDTASDAEPLITRPRDVADNAVPSGTSLAVELLLKLAELGHDADMRRRAEWVLETLAEPMARHAVAFGHLLGAADMAVHGAVEVAIVGDPEGDDFRALAATVAREYVPSLALAGGKPGDDADSALGDRHAIALLEGRPAVGGAATAYVCRQYVCESPATTPEALGERLTAGSVAAPPPDGPESIR
ncbi:MAG TPA: thioredoxin domain-containing protein [Gemmatimonadaceae bacterium]|nr:thioredoxin domain-containing protein [Gemmatimonadaceae bacterium]